MVLLSLTDDPFQNIVSFCHHDPIVVLFRFGSVSQKWRRRIGNMRQSKAVIYSVYLRILMNFFTAAVDKDSHVRKEMLESYWSLTKVNVLSDMSPVQVYDMCQGDTNLRDVSAHLMNCIDMQSIVEKQVPQIQEHLEVMASVRAQAMVTMASLDPMGQAWAKRKWPSLYVQKPWGKTRLYSYEIPQGPLPEIYHHDMVQLNLSQNVDAIVQSMRTMLPGGTVICTGSLRNFAVTVKENISSLDGLFGALKMCKNSWTYRDMTFIEMYDLMSMKKLKNLYDYVDPETMDDDQVRDLWEEFAAKKKGPGLRQRVWSDPKDLSKKMFEAARKSCIQSMRLKNDWSSASIKRMRNLFFGHWKKMVKDKQKKIQVEKGKRRLVMNDGPKGKKAKRN